MMHLKKNQYHYGLYFACTILFNCMHPNSSAQNYTTTGFELLVKVDRSICPVCGHLLLSFNFTHLQYL
jgi:hypothetical protein